jgi:hypothetical protein
MLRGFPRCLVISASDEVTHILHVSKELQPPIEGAADFQGSAMNETNG